MPLSHLRAGVHYRVAITTPGGELWAIHIQWTDRNKVRRSAFLKDEERIDEVNEIIRMTEQFIFKDAIMERTDYEDDVHIWNWQEAEWQLSLRLEPPPSNEGDDNPF